MYMYDKWLEQLSGYLSVCVRGIEWIDQRPVVGTHSFLMTYLEWK